MSSPVQAAWQADPDPVGSDDTWLIALVSLAHMVSHFSQLLLAPMFPWLREAFQASYTELGFLMTVYFVVSCVTQAVSGFWVDRWGPRPVLFLGLALICAAALGYAASPSYAALALCSVVAGIGNGVFHPVDYTLINRKVRPQRIGHAYSAHGICGSLGWALAPAMLVPVALAMSWRAAFVAAAALCALVLAVLWSQRHRLLLPALPGASSPGEAAAEAPLDFLRIPAVWMCFGFFFLYAVTLSVVQSFAPESVRQLHGVAPAALALCVTLYMGGAIGGVLVGGFLAADAQRCERVVGIGFGLAACVALVLGFATLPAGTVPFLFGLMGFFAGMAGPSRDLLVKKSTPAHATGRVYGVVYAGLDIGQALTPLLFGLLMDGGHYQGLWLALVLAQAALIGSAFRVRHARKTVAAEPLARA